MNGRITILCENSVGPISGTIGEHGFSALIEWNGGSLLFDTGQGLTLLHNAQRMNRNLHQTSHVALSHGHYDHSGGLFPLLRSCGPKRVFGHPDIFTPRFRLTDRGEPLSIGMPYPQEYLEGLGASFDLEENFREIAPSIFMTGKVPRTTDFETGDKGLFSDRCCCTPDPFNDDQSLAISTDDGLIVLLGCCHAGLINTLKHLIQQTGETHIQTLLGGTHLNFCNEEQLEMTIKTLSLMQIKNISVSHCTGFNASFKLSKELRSSFQTANVGYTLAF